MNLHFGWTPNPAATANYTATLPAPSFLAAAPHLAGSGEGKDVFLWEVEQKVLGKLLPSWDQSSIGSCVAHGWGRSVQDLLLVQTALAGAEQWEGEVAREPIYGGSRVQVGGDTSGEGSVGAWAAEWVSKWGVVLYGSGDGFLEGYYTVQRCRQWGSRGVPEQYQTLARKHPVKTVAPVTSSEQARDSLANLYPVAICGSRGRTMKRRPGGWCPVQGGWNHCQELRGVCVVAGGSSDLGGDGAFPYAGDVPALVYQNSWADYLGGENAEVKLASGKTVTLPQGCYLSTFGEADPDLRQGDSFAPSHALGWPAQTIPWIFN